MQPYGVYSQWPFFLFLRKPNLTVTSLTGFDLTHHLCHANIKFSSHGAVLRSKWSKTLQHRDRLLFVPLPSIPGSPLCPVSAIMQYFARVPAPASAAFFYILRDGALRPMTHTIFTNSIKSLISKIGLRPSDFSPHSFRRVGVTFAFQAGVLERLIQQHGNCRSDTTCPFLSVTEQWLLT